MSDTVTDPIHEALRAAIEVPCKSYLWIPAHKIEFVPRLSSAVFGDGRALMRITTINNRPAYWVVRVCSTWKTEDPYAPSDAIDVAFDAIDGVKEALRDEFGDGAPDYDVEDDVEVDPDGRPFPAFDGSVGTSWRRADWPDLPGVALVQHPFARAEVLEPRPTDPPCGLESTWISMPRRIEDDVSALPSPEA